MDATVTGRDLPMTVAHRFAALLGHLSLAAVAAWPLPRVLTTHLVGHPMVDVWNHAWGGWWFLECFRAGVAPLYTRLLGAPSGGYLWYIDPLGASFSMPIVAVAGPVVAWNLLVWTYLALASAAGRSLALALGASPVTAWFGAVATVLSPYVLSEVHNGITEAMGVCWAVFALAALARATREGARRREWAWLGLWGGLTAVGTVYYAIGLSLAAAPIVVNHLVRRPRQAALGVVIAALISTMFAVPAYLAVHRTLADPALALIARPNLALDDPWFLGILHHNAADPRAFLLPGEFQSVDVTPLGEFFRHTSYVGLIVAGLAACARRPSWLVAAAFPLVFSLGPFLFYDGGWVRVGSQLVALPYRLLFEFLPTGALGHPQRVVFPGLALLGALAALTLARAPKLVALGATAAMALEFLLVSPAPWPIAVSPLPDDDAAEYIRERVATSPARSGMVLDLPASVQSQGMTTSRYLMLQTIHRQPIPYGPDVRASGLKVADEAVHVLMRRETAAVGEVTADSLARAGVRFVVTHGDLADTSVEDWILRRVCAEPRHFGDVKVYELAESSASAP